MKSALVRSERARWFVVEAGGGDCPLEPVWFGNLTRGGGTTAGGNLPRRASTAFMRLGIHPFAQTFYAPSRAHAAKSAPETDVGGRCPQAEVVVGFIFPERNPAPAGK
jgi:hypothetical protein